MASLRQVPWAQVYLGAEEKEQILDCLQSGWYSMGPKVTELERLIGAYVNSKFAIAVNSGTAALDIALMVLGVRSEDEVILPAFTYIATANAVIYRHATPVFVDIDPDTFTIDVRQIEARITKKTKGIIAVDYPGQGPDYQDLKMLAKARGLFLLEDAAPSLGGRQRGQMYGTFGDVGITSFHAAKVFTTIEGGMLFTQVEEYDRNARIIRSQGELPTQKYEHPFVGHNYRMTDLHAAIGIGQFSRIDALFAKRRSIAERYSNGLRGLDEIKLPVVSDYNEHAFFLYPILVGDRDGLRHFLAQEGISTNISWPKPVYWQQPYKEYAIHRCSIAEHVCDHVLCLPIYFRITNDEQEYVIETIKAWGRR